MITLCVDALRELYNLFRALKHAQTAALAALFIESNLCQLGNASFEHLIV